MTRSAAPLQVSTGLGDWQVAPGELLLLGRDEEAQLRVEDPRVSRRHATIRHTGWGCLVSDLDSSAGTFVDGERLVGTRAVDPPFAVRLGGPGSLELAVRWSQDRSTAPKGADPPGPDRPHDPAPTGVALSVPGDRVVIGRDESCDLTVDDLLVSRQHVRLVRESQGVVVEDLGSRNGTFVDGERVSRAPLPPGALLTVGRHGFRLRGDLLRPDVDDGDIAFAAEGLGVTLPRGTRILDDVSFALPGASLMAVVGGSGAGKTTLLDALTGTRRATEGRVLYDGRDLYQHLASLRHRIGVVPQDDVVHPQLTARQALEYAAELRFPDDLDPAARSARVEEVMAELGLLEHAGTRVSALSGGQRKRVSVALELLTQPSLIFLDEPTSGLDMALVTDVMRTLRTLADGGRTVVVITHAAEGLELCDRVLVMAVGGRVAYFGAPDTMLEHFGTTSLSDAIQETKDDPEGVARRFRSSALHRHHVATPLSRATAVRVEPPEQARQQSLGHQVSSLVRRQLRVLLADRAQAAFRLVMPFVIAVLALVVPGEQGLGGPAAGEPPTGQPTQMLVVLTLGAVFMGISASIGDLVGERAIYLRERAVGLAPTAYLLSKLAVLVALVTLQTAVMVAVTLALRPGPDGAVLLGSGGLEITAALALCAAACVAMGLWVSAMVRTSEQMMPLLVVLVMVQLVLSGGLFPVDGRVPLEQLAWLSPSRWGYAATAGTVDATAITPVADDPLWQHSVPVWLGCLAALVVLAVGYALLARWRLGRRYSSQRG